MIYRNFFKKSANFYNYGLGGKYEGINLFINIYDWKNEKAQL